MFSKVYVGLKLAATSSSSTGQSTCIRTSEVDPVPSVWPHSAAVTISPTGGSSDERLAGAINSKKKKYYITMWILASHDKWKKHSYFLEVEPKIMLWYVLCIVHNNFRF